jgi:hypothetical protein
MIKAAAKPKSGGKKARKKPANLPAVQGGNSDPIKSNPGLPAHVPSQASRSLVVLACSTGFTREQIARQIGIAESTLAVHYGDELADAGKKLLLSIAGNLARIAQDPNHPKAVTAAIFWLKTRGGFKEDSPGPADPDNPTGPVTFTINIGGSQAPPRPGDNAKVVDA